MLELTDRDVLCCSSVGWDITTTTTTSFISHQRVKLSSDCFSAWGPLRSGVPQGTKLGLWLFLLMINDLKIDALTWRYVDDTTISQTIPRGSLGDVQHAVTAVEDWSRSQRMQLNADKCKEMVIDFKKISHNFSALEVDEKELPVTDCAKMRLLQMLCLYSNLAKITWQITTVQFH